MFATLRRRHVTRRHHAVHGALRPSTSSRPHFLRVEALEERRLLALVPELVADINPGSPDGSPVFLRNLEGTLFFSAYDLEHGYELRKSDGTAAGTQLVRDITPGGEGGTPSSLIDVDGVLYFTAHDGEHGRELWKSDGTDASTQLVRDIAPGPYGPWYGSNPRYPQFTNVNGMLLFIADDHEHGLELWRSDGTEAGTQLARDIIPGFEGAAPAALTAVAETLFFSAWDKEHGNELWRSDGTEAGTQLVRDIRPGTDSSGPHRLTNVNGVLFWVSDGALWTSDGTANGTLLVSEGRDPAELTNVNGTLFFVSADTEHGSELWTSDGTEAGTRLVRDIFPGAGSAFYLGGGSGRSELVNVDGTLYFSAMDPDHDMELWKSDGTETGTQLVKDIRPGPDGSYLRGFNNVNGTLFFGASNTDGDYGLWRSDGTEAGTQPLTHTPFQLNGGPHPDFFANVNGTPYFNANDGVHGDELWKLAPMPGDTNYDGVVDLADLNNVHGNFGYEGDERPGDTTGDGVVNLDDLNAVRNHFGEGTPEPARPAVRQSLVRTSGVERLTPTTSTGQALSSAAADLLFTTDFARVATPALKFSRRRAG